MRATEGAVAVLEIGPGAGVLTFALSDRKLIAVELDPRMIPLLKETAPSARIVEGDALKTDIKGLLRDLPEPRCVVSNMPYNITGPLLAKVTECKSLFRNAVLMMQREVGERILAQPGTPERGALSVSMQLSYAIRKVCDAPAGAFLPPPKVDSVVLDFLPSVDPPERTIEVVRTGFAQPRKTLANNLLALATRNEIETALDQLKLDHRIRPHQLTNDQWIALSEIV